MYKDLSLKEKAKVIREGVRLGLNSIDDIQNLYDEAISYQQRDPIVSPYGQWKYPGRDTIIPSNNITMDNVNYPVLGISNTGDAKVMMPWNDYKFRGSMVYEHPLVGNLAQEGKKFNRQRISDNEYFSVMEKVAEENNSKWNEDRKKRNQRQLSVDEELVRLLNSNDYDYRGYYTKYPNSKANADTHWTDEFKTVYHPTFSEESRYSGTIDRNYNPYGYIGGSWGNNNEFIPAPWQVDNQYQLGGEYNKYSIFDKWKGQVTKKQEEYNQMPIVNDVPIALPEVQVQSTRLGPIGEYSDNTSELKYNYEKGRLEENYIPKGLQKDAYTYAAELAPAMLAAGVPSIAYNTAMKVAQSGVAGALAKQAIASEIGGKGVDLASRAITGKSFGKNVENTSNGIIPEWFGQYLNPGYFVNGQNIVDGVVRNVTKRNINTPIKEVVENVKPFELDMTQGYYPENVPGSITELSYFGMTPKEAYIQANEDLGKIGIGGKFMLDYNGAMSSDSYPMMLNMMRREKTPNFNITQSMLNGSPKMMRLNDFGRVDSDFGLMRKLNPNSEKMKELSGMMWKNVDRINKKIDAFNVSRNMNIPHAYVPENDFMNGIYVPALQAERLYKQGSSIYIKPENRGKFTALKKRTGHSASWFKAHGTPAQKKMATFALNSRHWKHDNGGHLFQEDGQILKRPQDDLIGRNILTSPILPPKSYYEQFTIPELEPKKPQPLQPLEGTYGNKYSELVPMSDGTYVNNPINKGLQQNWRTHALEFAPFLAIGAGPAIGSTATWLASKPALYNLGRMTLGSEVGGRSVDLASNLFTDNTWGQNVGNVVEGITGWNPNNTMVGQFVTDLTNPGYSIGLGKNIKLKKDIDPNKLFSYSEAEYIKPEDFPQVNIFKNQKPKLDVENYLQKHKQRIVDKYGEDAYNKIKQYTYNQDEKSIKKAIRDAIWDDTHNLIYALDNNFINQKYKELAKQPAFNIGRQAIVVNPELTKKIYPNVFELYGDDAALGLIKSHELEHAINWYRQMHPDQKATNGLFDLTKILKDSTKNYFEKQNNTELSARGSQIKDYFDSDIISGDQLRFAARNYVKDTGIDNDMTAFFNGIKDWDGMAKWITKNSSIIATPFLIGNIINKYDKDQKNNQIYY